MEKQIWDQNWVKNEDDESGIPAVTVLEPDGRGEGERLAEGEQEPEEEQKSYFCGKNQLWWPVL